MGPDQTSAPNEAVKQALEAIHELDDGRRERGEWQQTGWSEDQIAAWRGLVGARNAVHHNNVPCVRLHSPAEGDDRLRWEIEQAAIEELESKGQKRDYAAHVAWQRVLPQLRDALVLVDVAVPKSSSRSG